MIKNKFEKRLPKK